MHRIFIVFTVFYLNFASLTDAKGGKAKRMCKIYGKSVFEESYSPIMATKPKIDKVSKCGIVETPLIVGGQRAHIREFPHFAGIGFPKHFEAKTSILCGGSLISEKYVLTAAHCLITEHGNATHVLLGAETIDKRNKYSRTILAARIIPHPKYKTKYFDIGLIEMAAEVRFNEFIRPACLNSNRKFMWNYALAIGFGSLSPGLGKMSRKLMKVVLKNTNEIDCKETYSSDVRLSEGMIASQFCAGELDGKKDTCRGDSGGPLHTVLKEPYCMYNVIGVTSFGKLCGSKPGIYTSVAHLIRWIEDIVWP